MGKAQDLIKEEAGKINANEGAKNAIAGWDRNIVYDIEGEESPFYIQFKDGVATFVEGACDNPSATLKADMETVTKIIEGGTNEAIAALTTGKLKIDGNFDDALKYAQIIMMVATG